jgi:methylated-DNA-[protein]-cysteine S-methyltransferase
MNAMSQSLDALAPLWIGELSSSPLGPLSVTVSQVGMVRLDFSGMRQVASEIHAWLAAADRPAPVHLAAALQQLAEYLEGRRRDFDLPIDWRAIPAFSINALQAAATIPFGQVRTYGELAKSLGLVNGARAIGQAMASNPIPIVLPCHRVVAAGHRLHGYSGLNGIQTKAWLLNLEGSSFQGQLF